MLIAFVGRLGLGSWLYTDWLHSDTLIDYFHRMVAAVFNNTVSRLPTQMSSYQCTNLAETEHSTYHL